MIKIDQIVKNILVFFYTLKRRANLKKKITNIIKNLPSTINISKAKKSTYRILWSKLGTYTDFRWYKAFASINNIDDPRYITEIDYYTKVEPVLNNRAFSEAYADKNFYHKYLDNNLLPNIYLRNIQGVYLSDSYDSIILDDNLYDFLPYNINKLIVKRAIDSGGGRDVDLFIKKNGSWINSEGIKLTTKYLDKIFVKNFIIQEYIQQHGFYKKFNNSSVNTIRLFTYRSVVTNEIIPLQSVLRIGKKGSIVDNQASGGIACGINTSGLINNFAIDKRGKKYTHFNGVIFSEFEKLLKYKDIVELGLELAKKFHYHRLLGFDFCVDHAGNIKLIEINNRNNEINFYQMNNGPLFREYTDEVISFCANNKRTFCFDFEH